MSRLNIVWLKRDFRLRDHAPLQAAQKDYNNSQIPYIVLYVFEPLVENYYDYDIRHRNFILDSLADLKQRIPISLCTGNMLYIMREILELYDVVNVFSHRETGLNHTFDRDIEFKTTAKSTILFGKSFS